MARWIQAVIVVLLACVSMWHLPGCATLTAGSSIENTMRYVADTVVAPAVQKAGEGLSSQTAQLTGQVTAIEPGYEVKGFAIFGTGLVYDVTVKAVGLSANVAGASQADRAIDD